MTNMIQNAKDQAAALAMAAYKAAAADGTLPEAEVKTAPVEIPKDTANGDYTTTFALAAAKALGKPPRVIAQALLDHMDLAGTYFTSAEIAGPGFLNFRLGDQWYAGVMNAVETEKDVYGTNDSLKGQKIMVEFVSANPTGTHAHGQRPGRRAGRYAGLRPHRLRRGRVAESSMSMTPDTRSTSLPVPSRFATSSLSMARIPSPSRRMAIRARTSRNWPRPIMTSTATAC